VTLNHLEALRKISDTPAVVSLIDGAIRSCIQTYSALSTAEVRRLDRTIEMVFTDRNQLCCSYSHCVKHCVDFSRTGRLRCHCFYRYGVGSHPLRIGSSFTPLRTHSQDGIQNLDGSIVLDVSGPLPPGTEAPGTIKYFDANGTKVGVDKVPAIVIAGGGRRCVSDITLSRLIAYRCSCGVGSQPGRGAHVQVGRKSVRQGAQEAR
jgi:hypothetical protein